MQVDGNATGNHHLARERTDKLRLGRAQLLTQVKPRPVACRPAVDGKLTPGIERLQDRLFRLTRQEAERVAVKVALPAWDEKAVAEPSEWIALVECFYSGDVNAVGWAHFPCRWKTSARDHAASSTGRPSAYGCGQCPAPRRCAWARPRPSGRNGALGRLRPGHIRQ